MTGDDDEPGQGAAVVRLPSGRAFLDLGNGEAAAAWCTADDLRAVAGYLEQRYPGGVTGPILNMGAANALGVYRTYASRVPPTSLLLLAYMATVARDRDAEPSWWEGHEVLAIRCLGRTPPPASPDLTRAQRQEREDTYTAPDLTNVEGAARAPGQGPDISVNGHRPPVTREETAAEAARQAELLAEWIRSHPTEAPS